MKINQLLVFVFLLLGWSCRISNKPVDQQAMATLFYDSTDITNDFYDNEMVITLSGSPVIEIDGEVAEPQRIALQGLPLRSVIVKETRIEGDSVKFTGAYRYDGFSLYDILDRVKVIKKNAAEFNPIIDQYVVVYNASGDSVVISWGELYYPVQRHQILIAQRVVRIVPSKTKDKWPLPERAKLIVGSDLITERNIDDPVRIAIRSISVTYPVDRSVALWAPQMKIVGIPALSLTLDELPAYLEERTFDHVFYGRGRGIHGITKTRGSYLKEMFVNILPPDRNLIRHGLFVIAAIDGYRCSMTYSEMMNRNDNAEVMIMDDNNYEEAGKFSCLFTADFFSDRAIKSMTEVRMVQGIRN